MKQTVVNIAFVVIVVLITWNVQARWFPTVEKEIVTDTVRVDRPFKIETIRQADAILPAHITIYETQQEDITYLSVDTDTVFVQTSTNLYTYHPSFLTQFPQAHKFLGLVRSRGQLSLTTLNTNGITETKTWDVGGNYRVDSRLNLSEQSSERFSYNYGFGAGYIRYWESGGPYLEFEQNLRIFGVGLQNRVNINENPFVTVGVTW